ncbi:Uncharacterized protein APZ42_006109 [Daphnia magna]|uniref:Uncharacterized protein n=1 Tax=Daphnia magna TaxID=35525 RepID=A0A164G358_9CRUS|nr:Uncharacterized protein APZ42_006109 [Daphnia magna]
MRIDCDIMSLSCSLPNRSTESKVGVIFCIPVSDSEDDILNALSGQNVPHVKRLPMRDRPDTRS